MKLTNALIIGIVTIVGLWWTMATVANLADFMDVFQDIRELEARVSAVELNCTWVGGEEMVCP